MHLLGLSVCLIHLRTNNNKSLSNWYINVLGLWNIIVWALTDVILSNEAVFSGFFCCCCSVEYLILIKCDYTGRDTYGCTGHHSVGLNKEDVIPVSSVRP